MKKAKKILTLPLFALMLLSLVCAVLCGTNFKAMAATSVS